MKARLRRAARGWAAACVLLAACGGPARAGFDDAAFGARDWAMGGAFTAVPGGVESVAYNPAALGLAGEPQAAASFLRHFFVPAGESDRDSTRAAGLVPVRTDFINGAAAASVRYDRRAGLSKDREIGVFYGTRGQRESESGGLDFGAGLKILAASPEAGPAPGAAPALDLGALWRRGPRLSFGASLLNLGGAAFRAPRLSDRAPLAARLGVAQSSGLSVLAADVAVREPSGGRGGSATASAGFERWWAVSRAGELAGRAGLSLGDRARVSTWGAGWRSHGGEAAYVLSIPLSDPDRLGHGLAVTLRFGRADPEGEYERLLSEELRHRRELARTLEAGEVRQWKLSEDLGKLREELDALRARLAAAKSSEAQAQGELQSLERRHRDALSAFEREKAEREKAAAMTKQDLFEADWRAYEKAKLDGAAEPLLAERLQRLLRQHRESGVDLSRASQELLRLQRSR